jgi:hypothetical protein
MDPKKLYQLYSEAGINFSEDLITNYCLSLYTKPFVILSGISGTGKTKIAQLFRPFELLSGVESVHEMQISTSVQEEYVTLKLTDGILNGDGRGNFKASDLPVLLNEEEYAGFLREKEELQESGRLDNFSSLYDFVILFDGKEHKVSFYVQRAVSPLVRVRFKSKKQDSYQYDLQPLLKERFQVGDIINLRKVEEKKFELVKVSDDVFDSESTINPVVYENNICIIPVKSDWTDSSGIIGYYNVIENKYHIGPFLRHLLFAQENPGVPFFLILDEMNLSKIEYYLSDVLSVLETRLVERTRQNGYTAEKIILHSAAGSGDYIDTDDEYFDIINSQIGIPPNFYITGTINIDETTYIPSPKVLDRANVIEFNTVSLNEYFYDRSEAYIPKLTLKSVPDFTSPKLPSIHYARSIPEFAKQLIISLNSTLKKYNMHFGYRVASEISLYITNALDYTFGSDKQLSIILDYQISQKILPKLSGAQSRIEKPIVEILSLLTGEDIDINHFDSSQIDHIDPSLTNFPISVEKLQNLYKRLVAYGFASSIE